MGDFVVDQDLTAQITRLRAIEGGLRSRAPLYAEHGDYFARAMVAASVIVFGILFVPTRASTACRPPRTG